jgi:amino acid adenylation domain-containing protein
VLDDRVEGLQGRVIYSTDLFDSETILRMIGHWQMLLEAVVADADCRISVLPIIPEQEKRKLLAQWTGPHRSYPSAHVHELFEEQAKETPDSIAVACGRHMLTYAELNARSNQLGRHLRSKGVGPEVPVALCVERSVEMIVGILGILKAGGAYVPLDASHPTERLGYMLADCKAPVLLTQGHLPPLVNNQEDICQICLDSDWRVIDRQSTEAPVHTAGEEDLAYIIYTSGSTGKPKGVLVTHRNLSQSNRARMDYYQDRGGRYLLLSSIGFDSSVAVIFHALCTGGMLVLPEPEFNWQLKQLAAIIFENRISHTLCVPSLYGELLEVAEKGQLASLRKVIVAGEACSKQLVESHYRRVPQASLFNEYGPTEATVWSTVHRCEPATTASLVPIGRPIANTTTYVFDRKLQPVPIGVLGELYIGGAGVARGYLNQPDLTKEKFIPNPLVAGSVEYLYKTGDIVRHLADGNIEFLARLDQQVKIRGARVELAEIEAALGEHPDVKEVAVAAQDGGDRSLRLMAYLVPRQGYSTSSAELRAFLKSRLPSYMVPSGFSFLPALPRTPHGKLDRQALSACENTDDPSLSRPNTPRDFIEARLLAIWKDVLAHEDLDITQDFFELGGHSLLAAKLLSRIEADFGQTLSLAFVFQAPTVELMAELLRQPDESLRARAIVPVQANGSRLPLFWVRGGPRFRLLAQKLGSDQPFLGLDLPFADASKFRTPYRLEDIAAYMVRAMREVQAHGPYSLAGLCVNAVIAYEIARQLMAEGEEVALVAMFDGHNHAYYKNPLRDGRYSGRLKYHLANLFRSDLKKGSAYLLDRLDEARRKIERTVWELSATNGKNASGSRPHNTDFIVHPAFHRYEPQSYPGKITLFQSSDWPEGPYFEFKRGWIDLARGGVDFYRIPGNHPSMFSEPNVNLVAAELSAQIGVTHPLPSASQATIPTGFSG